MGNFLGGMAFFAHETLHGSITKNPKLQNIIGFIGFGPFLISPTFWKFWHNRLHHGNTQLLYKDPDAFPTKMVWKRSKFMQWAFPLTPGSGHKRSYFYFFYWFSFQAFLNQIQMRFGNKMWDKMDHKKVTLEFALLCAAALCYVGIVGVENWLWLVILPFMIQNYTVMSYISTNHNISPYTKVNDPLVNSLSVTNHPILEKIHLNFGYHVEHHIFPRLSGRHTKLVSEQLKKQFPELYKIMPKSEALRLLYKTPRIYKNRTELTNPETDEVFKTLGS
jgi:fatty acid desaturase